MGGVFCCCPEDLKLDTSDGFAEKSSFRDFTSHPSDSSIALTVHQPLYPPGKIIHIVRNHPKKEDHKYETKWRKLVKKHDPVYQALWVDNEDFDEVLISPVMVQDHMPDKVLDALEKLLVNTGPAKPQRKLSENERRQMLSPNMDNMESGGARTPPHRLVLETSFTDLRPECGEASHGGSGNQKSNHSWEYSSTVVEHLDEGDNEGSERRVEKKGEEWIGMAPLASPETLSDVSSISSKGSNQKFANGNRLSWGGVPTMEPIAQSPSAQRPTPDSLGMFPDSHALTSRVDSGTSLADGMNSPVCHRVVTEATVEIGADREDKNSPKSIDPSRLCLNIEALSGKDDVCHGQSGADSTYASASTEQTIERLFTPHEPKRVTFDLYDGRESREITREESEDSMYNSGESFVPTYPEYSTQQEYGSHFYMYPPYGYANYSPLTSPSIEHSVSDAQLFTLADRPGIHRTHEEPNIHKLQDLAPVREEPIVTSSPRRPLKRNITVDADVLLPHSPHKVYREPPTESSL